MLAFGSVEFAEEDCLDHGWQFGVDRTERFVIAGIPCLVKVEPMACPRN
jgi:hypothetical protein